MKKYFKLIKWPLSLFFLSIFLILFTITFNIESIGLNLNPDPNLQTIKIGNLKAGKYHFYTKWDFNGETVGSLPADVEIISDKGELLVSHQESEADTLTTDFELLVAQNLHAKVRILDTDSISGAQARLIIAPERTWTRFLIILLAGLGILASLLWGLKVLVSEIRLKIKTNNS